MIHITQWTINRIRITPIRQTITIHIRIGCPEHASGWESTASTLVHNSEPVATSSNAIVCSPGATDAGSAVVVSSVPSALTSRGPKDGRDRLQDNPHTLPCDEPAALQRNGPSGLE